jgi:hypothetical protein
MYAASLTAAIIKSGRVKPIDGEAFFEELRQLESELFKRRSPK